MVNSQLTKEDITLLHIFSCKMIGQIFRRARWDIALFAATLSKQIEDNSTNGNNEDHETTDTSSTFS